MVKVRTARVEGGTAMKDIREVYPNCQQEAYPGCQRDEWFFSAPSDYGPLLESLGYKIVVQVDDDDYQGDSRLLLQDGERYGILIFGWGSCSGCDALQGCESYEEIDQLRNELRDSIQWFDSRAEVLRYVREHDWEGDFLSEKETKEFIAKAVAFLEKGSSE